MKNFILKRPLLKFGRSKEKHISKYVTNKKAQDSLDKVISLGIGIAESFHRGHTTC